MLDLQETTSHPSNTQNILPVWRYIKDCLNGAMFWCGYGFNVIPLVPGTKKPAVQWDPWLDGLDTQKILDYWAKNPSHELGFIVGEGIIVFDADTPESLVALLEIEARFGMASKLVVKTKKGEHHYFRRAAGTIAKSDSHSTEMYPNRLDIKTGRALVVLPPSTGKSTITLTAQDVDELSEATQEFIDAIFLHNGRTEPSQPREVAASAFVKRQTNDASLQKIEKLLDSIDPDCGYDDWLHCIMAVHHETNGSDEGLDVVDAWSSNGQKYKDCKEIETKWRSLKPDGATPYTIGTLIKMARDAGADIGKEDFEFCQTTVIHPADVIPSESSVVRENNNLDRYSMTGTSVELERYALAQVHVIGEIALRGQLTVICAEGGTGKTLLTFKLLTESIAATRINPATVYYLNMDDDYKGLVEKLKIAEEYGFNMLAEGHMEFKISDFRKEIEVMVRDNKASGVIIILDTLKKFVDPMKKSECREFNALVRQFSAKGGTLIALAHTNKHKGADGKLVFAGVGDLRDDFDCMYFLKVEPERHPTERIVTFECDKSRGAVVNAVSYRYSSGESINYNEMFLSVEKVEDAVVTSLRQAEALCSDEKVINAVLDCIKEDKNTKMQLVAVAAARSGASNRVVLKIIEKYTGDDPALHRWNFLRGERGKQIYSALILNPLP